MDRSRDWCFTLNNYTDDDVARVKNMECRYLIFGFEVGEKGTPHLQGYIYFKNAVKFRVCSEKFGNVAHIEKRMGTIDQAIEYCKKEGNYFEKGDKPMSQKDKGDAEKRRWEELKEHAKNDDLDWIREEQTDLYVRYTNGIKKLCTEYRKVPDMDDLDDEGLKNRFLWIWGPTGTGKSHSAREIAKKIAPNERPYLKGWNRWWDGFEGQKVVILEEADSTVCERMESYLKRWLDKWAFNAEIKGLSRDLRPEYIIITSNYPMKECITKPEDLEAMKRRVFVVNKSSREVNVDWPYNK